MGEYQKALTIISLCMGSRLPGKLAEQDDDIQWVPLRVGGVDSEAFAMKTVGDDWKDIALDTLC